LTAACAVWATASGRHREEGRCVRGPIARPARRDPLRLILVAGHVQVRFRAGRRRSRIHQACIFASPTDLLRLLRGRHQRHSGQRASTVPIRQRHRQAANPPRWQQRAHLQRPGLRRRFPQRGHRGAVEHRHDHACADHHQPLTPRTGFRLRSASHALRASPRNGGGRGQRGMTGHVPMGQGARRSATR
jgi:hypothetical protein